MKYKFLALLIILCLALCACSSTGEEVPATGETNAPTENVTDGAAATDSADTPTDAYVEPTDKGLFETEPEIEFTLPNIGQAIVLPEYEFGDEDEGVSSSRPLDETIAEEEETDVTEAATKPSYGGGNNVTLPEHVFDDE